MDEEQTRILGKKKSHIVFILLDGLDLSLLDIMPSSCKQWKLSQRPAASQQDLFQLIEWCLKRYDFVLHFCGEVIGAVEGKWITGPSDFGKLQTNFYSAPN